MTTKSGRAVFLMMAAAAILTGGPAQAQSGGNYSPSNFPHDRALMREKLTVFNSDGVGHDFVVEVAASPEDQERGLMFRRSVPTGSGMLFVFTDQEDRAFWMKNTLVPLDMLFVNVSGVISHIHANAVPNDLTPLPSEGPVVAVLELPGGTVDALGIKPGDRIYDGKNFTKLK